MDVEGVRTAEVSLENGTATVRCEQSVEPAQLINAVEEAGFGATLKEGASP